MQTEPCGIAMLEMVPRKPLGKFTHVPYGINCVLHGALNKVFTQYITVAPFVRKHISDRGGLHERSLLQRLVSSQGPAKVPKRQASPQRKEEGARLSCLVQKKRLKKGALEIKSAKW